ncbi:MAG: D-glycerate dehydrogenase [Candidatus Thorarchaeota archaeon]|nr:D-glycerate dehydrogenase [Candidatus Thorarchaeota archaeon]
MSKKVFVTRMIPEEGLEKIRQHFDVNVWPDEHPPSKEQIAEGAAGCEGIVTLLSDPIDRELIESLPNLRVIVQYAVGYDNIDIGTATEKGILVTNTPGVLTEATADLTWALILAAARRIVEADRYVREGKWEVAWGPKMLLGMEVFEATLGIIGMGRIGSAVARRAAGFSMNILYTSKPEDDLGNSVEKETGARRTDLETLLKESDIVSIHVPLTEETRNLVGSKEIASMKSGAILVNTSRGPVVDEGALYRALKEGKLASAGLDVFREEPIEKGNPLLSLSNVVLVPHIGSASVAARTKMAIMCASNLIAALNGKEPPNLVNPEVL